MKLSKVAIKNLVEYHLRLKKVQGWLFADNNITADPATRTLKAPDKIESWNVKETVLLVNGNIETWNKNDNLTDLRDAITDILFDMFTGAIVPEVDVSTLAGKKVSVVNPTTGETVDVVSGNVYTTGGGPVVPAANPLVNVLEVVSEFQLKAGLYAFRVSALESIEFSMDGGLTWTPMIGIGGSLEWSPAVPYNITAWVTYLGSLYKSQTSPNLGNLPTPLDSTYWLLFAEDNGDSTFNLPNVDTTIPDDSITNVKISSTAAIDATKIASGIISNTEFEYLNGLTGNIQTQINSITASNTTQTITTNHTVISSDRTLLCAPASGNITISLEAAATAGNGRTLYVKKTNSSYKVTIDGNGGDLIDGDGYIELLYRYDSVTLICDGTNWNVF